VSPAGELEQTFGRRRMFPERPKVRVRLEEATIRVHAPERRPGVCPRCCHPRQNNGGDSVSIAPGTSDLFGSTGLVATDP
jgi:hypothetical protein